MSGGEVVLGGTLKPDGTVQLDGRPNLTPGRVTVVLRQETGAANPKVLGNEFFQMMEEIWAGQQSRHFVPREIGDVDAERHELQSDVEQEIEAAIQLQEESRRLRIQAENNE